MSLLSFDLSKIPWRQKKKKGNAATVPIKSPESSPILVEAPKENPISDTPKLNRKRKHPMGSEDKPALHQELKVAPQQQSRSGPRDVKKPKTTSATDVTASASQESETKSVVRPPTPPLRTCSGASSSLVLALSLSPEHASLRQDRSPLPQSPLVLSAPLNGGGSPGPVNKVAGGGSQLSLEYQASIGEQKLSNHLRRILDSYFSTTVS